MKSNRKIIQVVLYSLYFTLSTVEQASFSYIIHFPDYTGPHLTEIFNDIIEGMMSQFQYYDLSVGLRKRNRWLPERKALFKLD